MLEKLEYTGMKQSAKQHILWRPGTWEPNLDKAGFNGLKDHLNTFSMFQLFKITPPKCKQSTVRLLVHCICVEIFALGCWTLIWSICVTDEYSDRSHFLPFTLAAQQLDTNHSRTVTEEVDQCSASTAFFCLKRKDSRGMTLSSSPNKEQSYKMWQETGKDSENVSLSVQCSLQVSFSAWAWF